MGDDQHVLAALEERLFGPGPRQRRQDEVDEEQGQNEGEDDAQGSRHEAV